MIFKKSLIAFTALCSLALATPAHAEEFVDNRGGTIGGDSGVKGNIVDVPADESAKIDSNEDSTKPEGVVVTLKIPTVESKMQRAIREHSANYSEVDVDSAADSASVGSGSSGSSQKGDVEISDKDIKAKVDKAVSSDNEKYKTVLDYFAANQDGAAYNWGGPHGEVGAGGDCSGFMSQLVQIVDGGNPWQRIFATGSEESELKKRNFEISSIGSATVKPGDFAIGFNLTQHTSGTLPSGVKVESGGANLGEGGSSINAYGRSNTAGWDGNGFTTVGVLSWDKLDDKLKWDVGVSEWEKYLEGISWKPWYECSSNNPGNASINPCGPSKDSIHKQMGLEDKIDSFPRK